MGNTEQGNLTIAEKQFEFIKDTFFANAWRDASQHVKIYLSNENDDAFKKGFRDY